MSEPPGVGVPRRLGGAAQRRSAAASRIYLRREYRQVPGEHRLAKAMKASAGRSGSDFGDFWSPARQPVNHPLLNVLTYVVVE